jgi:hypothetical protein
MSRHQAVAPVLVSVLVLAATPAFGRAQTIPPACRPLVDAERKEIMTPHHLYQTERSARPGDKERSVEGISVDGVTYIQVSGKWRRSPLSPKDALEQMNRNLTTATAFSCVHVGDESVGGAATAVYTAHTENEGVKADARTWVAKGTGLILRTEEDVDIGVGDKRHISIRYEHTNVQAPAGVK